MDCDSIIRGFDPRRSPILEKILSDCQKFLFLKESPGSTLFLLAG